MSELLNVISPYHGEIGCSKWKKTLAYLLVLPGSRARIVSLCGGRYDQRLYRPTVYIISGYDRQLVNRSGE